MSQPATLDLRPSPLYAPASLSPRFPLHARYPGVPRRHHPPALSSTATITTIATTTVGKGDRSPSLLSSSALSAISYTYLSRTSSLFHPLGEVRLFGPSHSPYPRPRVVPARGTFCRNSPLPYPSLSFAIHPPLANPTAAIRPLDPPLTISRCRRRRRRAPTSTYRFSARRWCACTAVPIPARGATGVPFVTYLPTYLRSQLPTEKLIGVVN